MSTSSPRYHIPFPTAFLSLNTPTKRVSTIAPVASVAPVEPSVAPHGFLSNRSHSARHPSVSSVSSVESIPSAPPASFDAAPILQPATTAFLALNSKYAGPPAIAQAMMANNSGFLSNRG
ncbi:hypothetical protein BDV95DRAFT_595249 [Massariosphaeria phaeospora]|uniref:Uncharacterized protein n=1 Tax=Massariosphaeria phaeospora TaxID=100035 RepID=A0A7C8MME5_9PLEO|nr:hypothetical protein BDV95DRAFT_595249 [Massariosphaeria phaeospora]